MFAMVSVLNSKQEKLYVAMLLLDAFSLLILHAAFCNSCKHKSLCSGRKWMTVQDQHSASQEGGESLFTGLDYWTGLKI